MIEPTRDLFESRPCEERIGLRMSVAMTNCGSWGWVLPAVFLFGGNARKDKQRRIPLQHGDVVVWGGPARLYHHGVLPLKDGHHPDLGRQRLNLTFRRAHGSS
jgi:alkylated DNA repair dioxygenase AlkB